MAAVLGDAYLAFQALVGRAGPDAADPEGRPVSVVIRRPSDIAKVEELIAAKLAATRMQKSKAGPRGGRTRR